MSVGRPSSGSSGGAPVVATGEGIETVRLLGFHGTEGRSSLRSDGEGGYCRRTCGEVVRKDETGRTAEGLAFPRPRLEPELAR